MRKKHPSGQAEIKLGNRFKPGLLVLDTFEQKFFGTSLFNFISVIFSDLNDTAHIIRDFRGACVGMFRVQARLNTKAKI